MTTATPATKPGLAHSKPQKPPKHRVRGPVAKHTLRPAEPPKA